MNINNSITNNIQQHHIPQSVLIGKPLLVFTSCFVSICVFLFGYDQGYFSSILTNEYFKNYYSHPSPLEIGTAVAILEIGALITSLSLGIVADKLGRRKTTRLGSFLFCLGGLFQTLSSNLLQLGIGRFISGLGVGFLSGTAPTYMSEIASPTMRGVLGSAQFTGNVLGYSCSIWIDYYAGFIKSNYSFRIPLALQILFGSILFFGSFILVESPRWLLEHDHDAEGLVVLADLFANGETHSDAALEGFRSIKEQVILGRLEGSLSYLDTIKRYPKRVFIGCSAQMFAQFNGINVISYYAPLVFEQAGWLGQDAVRMTGYNSLTYLLSTLIPWKLSESWGRKPLLIFGGLGMCISLICVSYYSSKNESLLVVLFVMIYNSFFGISWGPIGWLIGPEVLPNKARASGAALATATNWFCNFIVGELAPVLLDTIGWRLYLIHSFSCVISIGVVGFVYPETKGLSLEDMNSIFDDSSSVYSRNDSESNHSISSGNVLSTSTSTPAMIARNPNTESTPLLNLTEVEPPGLDEIYRYKTDDSRSISSSIRKGSEAISAIFKNND